MEVQHVERKRGFAAVRKSVPLNQVGLERRQRVLDDPSTTFELLTSSNSSSVTATSIARQDPASTGLPSLVTHDPMIPRFWVYILVVFLVAPLLIILARFILIRRLRKTPRSPLGRSQNSHSSARDLETASVPKNNLSVLSNYFRPCPRPPAPRSSSSSSRSSGAQEAARVYLALHQAGILLGPDTTRPDPVRIRGSRSGRARHSDYHEETAEEQQRRRRHERRRRRQRLAQEEGLDLPTYSKAAVEGEKVLEFGEPKKFSDDEESGSESDVTLNTARLENVIALQHEPMPRT